MAAARDGPGSELPARRPHASSARGVWRRKAARRSSAFDDDRKIAALARAQQARGLVQVLGMIGLAAAVVGASGQLLAANRLFSSLPTGVVRLVRGRPRLADVAADRIVAEALTGHGWTGINTTAIRGADGRPSTIVHLIGLPGGTRDAFPGSAAILVIAPLGARAGRASRFCSACSSSRPRRRASLVVSRPAGRSMPWQETSASPGKLSAASSRRSSPDR